jgi:hypothetical protein
LGHLGVACCHLLHHRVLHHRLLQRHKKTTKGIQKIKKGTNKLNKNNRAELQIQTETDAGTTGRVERI